MSQTPALPDPAKDLAQLLLEGETGLLYQGAASRSINGMAKDVTLSAPERLQAMRQPLDAGQNLRVNIKSEGTERVTKELACGHA